MFYKNHQQDNSSTEVTDLEKSPLLRLMPLMLILLSLMEIGPPFSPHIIQLADIQNKISTDQKTVVCLFLTAMMTLKDV